MAPYADRVRMLELACANDARFEVSRIEAPPPSGPPSGKAVRNYSILTIEKLKAAGFDPLSFLIGADAFAEIRTWHRWRDVVASVGFIVVTRPGSVYETPPEATVHELTGIESPVSSSLVRARILSDGEVPVPDTVSAYIRDHGLYRSQTA